MLIRILITVMFLVTACAPNSIQNSNPLPENVEETARQPSAASRVATEKPDKSSEIAPFPSPIVEDGLAKEFIETAMDDLATRLPADRKAIRVISTESTTWPDAALGCPSPDKVYAQGKVAGFRIRLKVNGQIYDYHTDRTGRLLLCLEPEVKPSEPGLR